MKKFLLFFLLMISHHLLICHEEHTQPKKELEQEQLSFSPSVSSEKKRTGIIQWFGNFHPVLLHFPIALITMTVIAELFFVCKQNPLFDSAARFMLIGAALFVIPTVLSGLAFSYEAHYEGVLANIFWWHRFFGLCTAILTLSAVSLREIHARKNFNILKAYYVCLALLFISVNITGYLGGEMTFGIGNLIPHL